MKILILKYFTCNAFVDSLAKAVSNIDGVTVKYVGLKDACLDDIDVLIVQWASIPVINLIKKAREKKVLIVQYVHNLHSHNNDNGMYDRQYDEADVFVHLGIYSNDLFEKKYPNKKHILSKHHIYDNIINVCNSKRNLLLYKYNLKDYKYIYCKGVLRNNDEIDNILALKDFCLNNNYRIIAELHAEHTVKISKSVSYDYLSELMTISDCVWINRPKNLNSGNVSLGMMHGKPLIIPKVGNMWQEAIKLGNGVYETLDEVPDLILNADQKTGAINKQYAYDNLRIDDIAKDLIYKLKQI